MGISAAQEADSVKKGVTSFPRKDISDALTIGRRYLDKRNLEKGLLVQRAEYDGRSHCWRFSFIATNPKRPTHILSVFDSGVVIWSQT